MLGTMPTIRDMSNDILFYVIISESLAASVSVSTAGRNRNASFLGRLWNTDGKLDGREFTLTLFEGNFSAEMKRRTNCAAVLAEIKIPSSRRLFQTARSVQ